MIGCSCGGMRLIIMEFVRQAEKILESARNQLVQTPYCICINCDKSSPKRKVQSLSNFLKKRNRGRLWRTADKKIKNEKRKTFWFNPRPASPTPHFFPLPFLPPTRERRESSPEFLGARILTVVYSDSCSVANGY